MSDKHKKKKRVVRYSGGWVTPYIPYVMNQEQFPGTGGVGGEVGGGETGGGDMGGTGA